MRLSRANLIHEESLAAADLVAKGDLDLLQVDFPASSPGTFADRFLEHLRSIHKFFFLEPRLRLITNAGGGNVVACVEKLGEYLREHGDANMPITAIRGDNILARLPELGSLGVEFEDEHTGERISIESQTVLSAQVSLGAGPLAAALAEESRMIVVGSYDPVAPFLSAGVALADFAWDDFNALAELACASEISSHFATITEISDNTDITILQNTRHPLDDTELRGVLGASTIRGAIRYADVVVEVSSLSLRPLEHLAYSIDGVLGRPGDDCWRVRLVLKDDQGQQTECWSNIARDAIPFSVDTRSAAEWL